MENKQIYFLPDNIINEIASKLNDCLPKETKKQLKAIQDKFGFKLTYDRQTNANLLWQSISDELKQTDIKKSHLYLGERTYVQMMNDAHSVSQDMLKAYIFPKYEKENSLIHNFNYEIIEHINAIIRIYGIFINIKFSELLEISDFKEWLSMYGKKNVDKSVKNTERVVKFFDELFAGIPNKGQVLQLMQAYYTEIDHKEDIALLHYRLHSKG